MKTGKKKEGVGEVKFSNPAMNYVNWKNECHFRIKFIQLRRCLSKPDFQLSKQRHSGVSRVLYTLITYDLT